MRKKERKTTKKLIFPHCKHRLTAKVTLTLENTDTNTWITRTLNFICVKKGNFTFLWTFLCLYLSVSVLWVYICCIRVGVTINLCLKIGEKLIFWSSFSYCTLYAWKCYPLCLSRERESQGENQARKREKTIFITSLIDSLCVLFSGSHQNERVVPSCWPCHSKRDHILHDNVNAFPIARALSLFPFSNCENT